jgi:acetylglutamate kinase
LNINADTVATRPAITKADKFLFMTDIDGDARQERPEVVISSITAARSRPRRRGPDRGRHDPEGQGVRRGAEGRVQRVHILNGNRSYAAARATKRGAGR